jgi:hypothetical protein
VDFPDFARHQMSYIFYFIVVHLKSQSGKENLNTFVATKSYSVEAQYKSQMKAIHNSAGVGEYLDYPKLSEIESMFKAINPKSEAPLMLGQHGNRANWMQFMSYHNNKSQNIIKKIFI